MKNARARPPRHRQPTTRCICITAPVCCDEVSRHHAFLEFRSWQRLPTETARSRPNPISWGGAYIDFSHVTDKPNPMACTKITCTLTLPHARVCLQVMRLLTFRHFVFDQCSTSAVENVWGLVQEYNASSNSSSLYMHVCGMMGGAFAFVVRQYISYRVFVKGSHASSNSNSVILYVDRCCSYAAECCIQVYARRSLASSAMFAWKYAI